MKLREVIARKLCTQADDRWEDTADGKGGVYLDRADELIAITRKHLERFHVESFHAGKNQLAMIFDQEVQE